MSKIQKIDGCLGRIYENNEGLANEFLIECFIEIQNSPKIFIDHFGAKTYDEVRNLYYKNYINI